MGRYERRMGMHPRVDVDATQSSIGELFERTKRNVEIALDKTVRPAKRRAAAVLARGNEHALANPQTPFEDSAVQQFLGRHTDRTRGITRFLGNAVGRQRSS